jgi:hypothetical protein
MAMLFVLAPVPVFGQGAFGGVVRDASGAVLPGVTVEAASPALIERVRSATTDANGQYLIVDLRPGVYSLTFSLTGFTTLKREQLTLSAGVTVPINAELTVAAVQETVTVTGATPVVDVQNTRQQTVMSREILDAVPRTRQQLQTALLLPGMVSTCCSAMDVGGSTQEFAGQIAIHGGDTNDQIAAVDGMKITEGGYGARRALPMSDNTAEEYTVETSALSAEFPTGGVRMNLVPKEGGNAFRGVITGAFTTSGMVADNLTDDLKARGLTSTTRVGKVWDISPALGGPILRDRVWFYGTYRHWGNDNLPAGAYYLSDPVKPATDIGRYWDANLRVTWQATPRNKVSVFHDQTARKNPFLGVSGLVPPETSTGLTLPNVRTTMAKWNSPLNNRLLLEVSGYHFYQVHEFGISPASALKAWVAEPTDPAAWPAQEISTGKWIGGSRVTSGLTPSTLEASWWGTSGSMSYVTGSHNIKLGFTHVQGYWFSFYPVTPPVLRYSNGLPFQVQLVAKPGEARPRANHDLGLYAQDQWTMGRLTLNLGMRYDYINEQVDPQFAPASRWYLAERSFDVISDVPNWKDISTRVGLAYDLFGNSKTAVKTSLSRYVAAEATNFAGLANPLAGGFVGGATDLRSWIDLNGDRMAQDNEIGPSTNLNYGKPVFSQRPSDDLRDGWGKRGYNWEYVASIQHQLLPGLALSVGYYRRWFGNLTWTNNLLVAPTDFTPFTLISPLNGEAITQYNLSVEKRGLSDNLITFAPDNSKVFNGVDVLVNGRFGRSLLVNGGVSLGRTVTASCTTSDPNNLRFCRVAPPFMAGNQYKFVSAYTLPYDVQVSGTFQSVPGPLIAANYTYGSAAAGVPLTAGSLTVNLVEPGSMYGDRLNRVDLRVGKRMRIGPARLQPYVDLLNVFNASPVISLNNTYGPAWQRPLTILVGRMVQIGAQVDF